MQVGAAPGKHCREKEPSEVALADEPAVVWLRGNDGGGEAAQAASGVGSHWRLWLIKSALPFSLLHP
jgi:hypothetical protein